MVRLNKNVGSGLSVSVEGETFIDAFEQMAGIEECFEPNPANPEGEIRLRVRNSTYNQNGKEKTATYYELVDLETKAVLSLSCHDGDKKGSLYPKRRETKNEDGTPGAWRENRGWVIYKPANSAPVQQQEPVKSSKTQNKKPKVDSNGDEIPF